MQNPRIFLIILITIGIVLGPICVYLIGPESQARWLLAYAANEYESGRPEVAKKTLEKAFSTSADIAADPQYWALRFQTTLDQQNVDSALIEELFHEAATAISNLEEHRGPPGIAVASLFENYQRLDLSITLLEKLQPDMNQRTPTANNALAWYRSLVKKKLDVGLREINLAIQQAAEKNESGLFQLYDTKAWVLHGLGRDAVAFKFADRSVKEAYDAYTWGGLLEPDPITIPQPNERITKSDTKQNSNDVYADLDNLINELILDQQGSLPGTLRIEGSMNTEVDIEEDRQFGETPQSFSQLLSQALKNVKPLSLADPLGYAKSKLATNDHYTLDQVARQIAVLRYHRACILEGLGRIDEAENDYAWLDRFGFVNTRSLR